MEEKASFVRVTREEAVPLRGEGRMARPPVPPVLVPDQASVPQQHQSVGENGTKPKFVIRAFDGVISTSLFMLFFGLPLFFTGLTFQGVAFEKQMYFYFWLLIALVAWVSRGVVEGELRIRRTPLDLPIILFFVAYLVSSIISVDRWHSFWGVFNDPSRGLLSVGALILAYYLIASHVTPKRIAWMFGGFLASGLIVSFWSALAFMTVRFLPDRIAAVAPVSLIGSVSTVATFLGVLLPLFITAALIMLQWRHEGKGKRIFLWSALFFLTIGTILDLILIFGLSGYMPWIPVFAGMGFFLVYILAKIVQPEERYAWIPMVAFVALLLFFMLRGSAGFIRANLPVEIAPSPSLSWDIAKGALTNHFFFGVGAANYGYAFSLYKPTVFNLGEMFSMRFPQGTGIFFDLLPAIGAVGAIAYLLLAFSFLSVGVYLLSHERTRNRLFSLGLWSAVMTLFVGSFVSTINGPLLLIGGLLSSLALSVLLWESGSEERYFQLSLKASPKFALALAFIFMVVSAGVAFLFVYLGKVFVADVYAGRAAHETTVTENGSIAKLSRAAELAPFEAHYQELLAQQYLALTNDEAAKQAAKSEGDRDSTLAAAYARTAKNLGESSRTLMPNDVAVIEALGTVYENLAAYDDKAHTALTGAESQYTRALELDPRNPILLVKLGQVKEAVAGTKSAGVDQDALIGDAKTLFQKAIDEKSNFAPAYYNMAVAEMRLKDTDSAIDHLGKAVQLDPKNANYRYNLALLYQSRGSGDNLVTAESIFLDTLKLSDKFLDVRLSLALLYEKEGKRDAAIGQYQKALDVLPNDDSDTTMANRKQVQTFIDTVRNGGTNIKKATQPATAEQLPSTPSTSASPIGQ